MDVEFAHREIRFRVSSDRGGVRMWTVYPEERVLITGTVERHGLEDILRRTILDAQEAIDEWLDAEPGAQLP